MEEKVRYDSNGVRLRTGEYERCSGQYEYRYSVFGHAYSIYAASLEELRDREAGLLSLEGERILKRDPNKTTLNDVFEIWKELKRGLRQNTFYNYCYMYNQYVKDGLGRRYITTIKKTDVKRLFNYLADERRLKVRTIDGVHTILHQVLQVAVDDEWILQNPSDQAVKELMRAHNLGREKHQALTKKEQELLLSYLSENTPNSRWYPITAVLLGTGMRVGEATGLRWCDVDFEEEMIDVNHTLVFYSKGEGDCVFSINDTKTPASRRQIPMTSRVRETLLREKEIQMELGVECTAKIDGYTDFVFLNRFGSVHHQGSLNKVFRRIIRDCNDAQFLKSAAPEVLLPRFSCHNLRHTFATRLCDSGVNIKMIQGILGNADISTTMNIYTHVTKKMQKEAKQIMEEKMV